MNKKIILIFIITCVLVIFGGFNYHLYAEMVSVEKQYRSSEIVYSYDAITDTLPANCKLEEHDYTAERITKINDGYFASFKNTYFGTVKVILATPSTCDDKFTITLGELSSGNDVWTRKKEFRGNSGQGIIYYSSTVYVKAGEDSVTLKIPVRSQINSKIFPRNWVGGVTPFCFCKISCCKTKVKDVIQKAVYYSFDDTNFQFISSDNILNNVDQLCKDTLKATTYSGYFVDGFREITPYELDAYINTLGWFSVSDKSKIVKNTIAYIVDHHTWPTEWMGYTIFLAHDYYMETGDSDFIKNIYGKLQNCLLIDETDEHGLVDSDKYDEKTLNRLGINSMSDIIDWPQSERDNFDMNLAVGDKEYFVLTAKALGDKYKAFIARICDLNYVAESYETQADSTLESRYKIASPNAVVNAVYYQSLIYMKDLAQVCGKNVDAKNYITIANKLKAVYQKTFVYDGKIVDSVNSKHSSLQSCVFALDFGLVPNENINSVVSYIEKKGMKCSTFVSQFLLEALFKYGDSAKALDYITATNDTSWYNMSHGIGSKLTTESWNFDFKSDMDLNHAWSTSPINITKNYIIGIAPEVAGYSVTSFKPDFFSIDSIQSSVPTALGQVNVDYEKNGGVYKIKIGVPDGMQMSFKLSEYDNFSLCEIDNKIIDVHRNYMLNSGRHIIILRQLE